MKAYVTFGSNQPLGGHYIIFRVQNCDDKHAFENYIRGEMHRSFNNRYCAIYEDQPQFSTPILRADLFDLHQTDPTWVVLKYQ